jgi:hypothetical protein
MLIEAREAEFLCTTHEFRLYLESCDPWIRQYRGDHIRQSVRRALKLSAMWTAKADSDRQDTRVRQGRAKQHSHTGHVLAQRKAELFSQIAGRFTSRLQALSEIRRIGHGIAAKAAGAADVSTVLKVRTTTIENPRKVGFSRK